MRDYGTSKILSAVIGVCLVILSGCVAVPTDNSAIAQFEAIYQEEWDLRGKSYLESADIDSSQRFDDVSSVRMDATRKYLEGVQIKLQKIDQSLLSIEDQINFQIYARQIAVKLDELKFRDFEKPLNSDSSFWSGIAYGFPKKLETEQDAIKFIAKLEDLPRFFDQQMDNMRAGLKRGFTPPRVTLEGREQSILNIVDTNEEDTSFYAPFENLGAGVPPEKADTLKADARRVIRDEIKPAYEKLAQFYIEEYLPQTVVSIAATDLPDGANYYQAQIRKYTTLDLTPDEIHNIGLSEVAKIRSRMDEVIAETGFDGSFEEFLHFLRTDPQFYAKTERELLMRGAWTAKKFDAKAEEYFGRIPRKPFAIRPVAADIAPFYTSGRGGPGTYWINTYNLPSRPLYSLPALTLHEAAPGHAFQIPLSHEQDDQPEFRRKDYISAYGEGWALYAETLGEEMGIYETPYEIFGMLSYQMWRASRLVVDTGVHAKGWSRDEAQAFLRTNTALAEHEIVTEVDRYISWPGQALSYYLGEMTILKLRAQAEDALGAQFDLRYFHDAVLQIGSVPLPVLEEHIQRFIEGAGKDPYLEEK